jgi:hypothetical protein
MGLPSLIYHEPMLEVRFVRGAAGPTSFLTKRPSALADALANRAAQQPDATLLLSDTYSYSPNSLTSILGPFVPRTRSRPKMSSGAKNFFESSDIQEVEIALKLATVSICQRQADLGPDQVSRKGACMTITPSLFEACLKCPIKCFLRWLGETSTGNECADFDRAQL